MRRAEDVDTEEGQDQLEEKPEERAMDHLIPVLDASDIQIYFTAHSPSLSDEGEVEDFTVSDRDE